MTNVKTEEFRGNELVVEFIAEARLNCGDGNAQGLIEMVEQWYGCSPSELKITDQSANDIIKLLFAKSSEEELKATALPFNSK